MSLRVVILCALLLMVLSIANADSVTFDQNQSVSIPTNVIKKPAADLLGTDGQPMDPGQASALAQKGVDLSTLNPIDNKMWQNKIYSVSDSSTRVYPKGNNGVKFLSFEAQLPAAFTAMMRVQSQENPKQFYRMGLSRFSHEVMMRAGLLRKLGYFVPSPKYYKDLRVSFADEEEKNIFLETVQSTMTSDFESRGWITQNDTKTHTLVFSDAVLEPAQSEYFDIHWGFAPNPQIPDQLAMVQLYSKFRAYRALILPFALVDIPESINRYSPKMGSILSGFVVINHPSANSFSAVTIEDMKWLVRRLGQLTLKDYQEIVAEGAFPQELQSLVLAKLLYRASNNFELFQMQPQVAIALPSLDITTPSGLVQHGKVMQEFVPGYPQRFAQGDRESPFKPGDFGRYLNIQGKTALLSTAIGALNEKLQIISTTDLAQNHREDIQNMIIDHIKNNPKEPLYQQVEAWGGPVAGFNVASTRHVATGTYYGSSAAIQLVDNLSVSGSLGYFQALDGLPKVTPFAGANVSVQRDYTHVRPLLSITEGTKVSWQNVIIPKFMNKISDVLQSEDLVPGATANDPKQHPLDAFLNDMREGEVFTVTDSVALSAYAQLSASLDVLVGIAPMNFLNSVSLGVDGSKVILQQTSFMRTGQGVQVFVRKQKGTMFGLTLDVNYFINLLRVRSTTQSTDIHSDAFVIDYNPADSALAGDVVGPNDSQAVQDLRKQRTNLRVALMSVFKQNETEPLYVNFKYQQFQIDQKLKTKEQRTKFLLFRADKFNEDHWISILYPRSQEAPELNPEDEKVMLYRRKQGELEGRDLLGLFTDVIQGALNKGSKINWDLAQTSDPNPANIPFGKAYWRMVTTEGDMSPNQTQYPSVAMLQHVWGGWHLKSDKFMSLIDEIQAPFQSAGIMKYRLLEKEAFLNVTAIDFYRVTAQLSLLPGGVDKIRDLITQPDSKGDAPKYGILSRIFQKLSEKISGTKARTNDKDMYDDVMKILGNGDQSVGQAQFTASCKAQGTPSGGDGAFWQNGTAFDCLTPWLTELLKLSAHYPSDKEGQIRWTTDVLYIIDKQIPLPQLLKYLGETNFIFFVRVNGFRTGDEDGDLEYFSNTVGDPEKNSEYANGLVSLFAGKTRISPIELDRSQGGFR